MRKPCLLCFIILFLVLLRFFRSAEKGFPHSMWNLVFFILLIILLVRNRQGLIYLASNSLSIWRWHWNHRPMPPYLDSLYFVMQSYHGYFIWTITWNFKFTYANYIIKETWIIQDSTCLSIIPTYQILKIFIFLGRSG